MAKAKPIQKLQIEWVPLDTIEGYEHNPSLHPQNQIDRIISSIEEFGFNIPISIDDQLRIIAGHGRYEAARQMELAEIPIIRLDHLSESQARAFRIADNRLNELGGWDEALLVQELQAVTAEDYDIELTGYTQADLDALQYNWPDNQVNVDDEWQGMPSYQEDPSEKPVHTLVVNFYTEEALQEFEEKLGTKLVFKGDKVSLLHAAPARRSARRGRVRAGGRRGGGGRRMSFRDWMRYLFKPRSIPFVCEFSKRNPDYDIHDFPVEAGGDGIPTHFYTYTCHHCDKKFSI